VAYFHQQIFSQVATWKTKKDMRG